MANSGDATGVNLADPETEGGSGSPPSPSEDRTPGKRRRSPLFFVGAIVVGVIVYALAFQQTQVDLTQITSETRQRSLENILRALSQPDLVTYDTTEDITEIDVAIPCGPDLSTEPSLVAEPQCGDPGDIITVTGTDFEPRELVTIVFVPDSDFDVTLRLTSVETDLDGNLEVELTLPERTSEEPQQLRAVTQDPIGTWGNRVEVYTDANENGVEDDPILGEDGTYSVSIPGNPDLPAVALINPAGEVSDFATVGESFEAITGTARGQLATPLGEESAQSGLRVTNINAASGNVVAELEGPPGMDLTSWRAGVYDGATGEPGATTFVSDTIQLSPRISQTARISLDKILETVFLALIATTAGLLLAVPLSFIAARNIMRDISITVTNLVLILISIPLGAVIGVLAARGARAVVQPMGDSLLALFGWLVAASALAWFLVRRAFPTVDAGVPTRAERLQRGGLMTLAGATSVVALLLLSLLLQELGRILVPNLGWFDFIGSFFAAIGEILDVALTVIAALAVAGVFSQLASKLGYGIRRRAPRPIVRVFNVIMAAVAGALWALIVGQILDWFYEIASFRAVVVIPSIVGAVVGVAIALRGMHTGEVKIGLSIYYAARTIFNTLRSIEPLVMAIVFVVWVGAGPFAGSLALALHTAAALAKLYSEQVESIQPGPIEAVRATGANRVQSIVYSVVPQIVPPYISFTMYRWDINVRMSTILGFVGGGGIGSILQQNINLLQYRAAAVQMLAIAIVVASMDYASSRMREHFV